MKDSDSELKNKFSMPEYPKEKKQFLKFHIESNENLKEKIKKEGQKGTVFILLCVFFFLTLAIYLGKKDNSCFWFAFLDGTIASIYFYHFYVEREKRINKL